MFSVGVDGNRTCNQVIGDYFNIAEYYSNNIRPVPLWAGSVKNTTTREYR